ncbi:hypothetical protein ABIE50_003453 [Chitinophaga sp. OAE865]
MTAGKKVACSKIHQDRKQLLQALTFSEADFIFMKSLPELISPAFSYIYTVNG